MKKLLGVIGILALAAALLPAQGYADLRGSFAPLTSQDGTPTVNGLEQGAFRPVDVDGIMLFTGDAGGRLIEEWFSDTSRSLIPGHESVRSIYLHLTAQQSGYFSTLLSDPAANISYFDPAWSSDGRFLAYIQSNADGTNQQLFVQEYFVNDDFEAIHGGSYPVGQGSDSPVGSPILVAASGHPRHPDWSPTGHTLAYDSDAGGSLDIYTVDVDVVGHTAGTPVRRTFNSSKAETDPAWAPNGHDIAYSTNRFGPRNLEIIDISLPSSDPGYTRLAERNFAPVSHNNPDYSSDGNTIYYNAPDNEDNSAPQGVWLLNLTTQGKCEIQFDQYSDADPNVSGIVNNSDAGPFNYFIFTSQAAQFGTQIWKGNSINSCQLPLEMGVATIPAVMDLNDQVTPQFEAILNFPPETQAAGYRCKSTNGGGKDGVRLRGSILNSPTLMGLGVRNNPDSGIPVGYTCFDSTAHGLPDSLRIKCYWDFRDIADRVVALGLVNTIVPMKVTAYSNQVGRGFQGFAYVRLTQSSLGPAALLGNSPNPFNPVTRIKFSVAKAGTYALRVYSVQGSLIRTVANQYFAAGTHEATWDGRTNSGGKAASGVYYAKLSGAGKISSAELKLVLAK